ncbi:G-protein coupled receptors family 1 profile domain-containing protein [Caenorhabditis elegans]|uniref:G-protein coupled receptors family 1 profile domain-containing protein n=2 Tax=Caenorhabditis elegans TaxID=6239 RepID=G4SNR2_CAEEL|nr:G-protein coupled receptors family 1 profile domain-containing protein [Caenorhabditis elegans]CCD73018.2 G-protein coupled receptors family 1 profile domain-containing protein [Caenorhabditis elegans]
MNAADDENITNYDTMNSSSFLELLNATSPPPIWTLNSNLSTTMSTVHQEEICRFRGTTENYTIAVTFFMIFLLSVVGNSVVLIVIIKQRAMRSITNIYLMNLAASDMMLSVVCMPPTLVSMVMNCWMFGNYMCKILAYLQPVVVTASAYTLAVIAFERYFAICKPLHSRIWQTRSHAYAMITLVWVIAIAANILMLFMYEQQTYSSNGYTCAPIHPPIYHFAYQVYMTVVLLVIPLVVMAGLYGNVITSLKSGIKLEIASVDPPLATATTTGAKNLGSHSDSAHLLLNNVLVGSSQLARATSCIALNTFSCNNTTNPFSTLTPPPPIQQKNRSKPQLLQLPGKIDNFEEFRLQCLSDCRSDGVLFPPPAIVASMTDEQKLSFWNKLSNKLTFSQQDKTVQHPNFGHRKSDTSICLENPSLRSTHTQKSAMAKQRVIKMLIVVVIIFFCCWTPSYIWWLLLIAGDSFQSLNLSVWNSDINTFITLLTYISSCTNPITYCFLNKKFRNAVYATFGRKKNMRHHFQKVYIPVNGGTNYTNKGEPRQIINRSVSSTFTPQHQVVFNDISIDSSSRKKDGSHTLISRTVHASLIHHNKVRKDESDAIF